VAGDFFGGLARACLQDLDDSFPLAGFLMKKTDDAQQTRSVEREVQDNNGYFIESDTGIDRFGHFAGLTGGRARNVIRCLQND
jgi:hypothetical protein